MDKVKIIEEMIATRTGRPPNKLLKVVEYLMSFPSRDLTVRDIMGSLGLRATTVNDAFKKLEKLGYLDKRTIQKEEYKEERRIKTGKTNVDIHRLPYLYKLNKKFYDDFDGCRERIQKKADEEYANASKEREDSRIIQNERRIGYRAHVALIWKGIWDTDFGRLEIKGGNPTIGKYTTGKIEGKAISDTLIGKWFEGTKSGSFEFKMDTSRRSFSGIRCSYINQQRSEWNGTLLPS